MSLHCLPCRELWPVGIRLFPLISMELIEQISLFHLQLFPHLDLLAQIFADCLQLRFELFYVFSAFIPLLSHSAPFIPPTGGTIRPPPHRFFHLRCPRSRLSRLKYNLTTVGKNRSCCGWGFSLRPTLLAFAPHNVPNRHVCRKFATTECPLA